MSSRSRPAADRAAAIKRLSRERHIRLTAAAGTPFELAGVEVRPSVATLIRWGTEGKGGVFLDVLKCKTRRVWVTSREAITRFTNAFTRTAAA